MMAWTKDAAALCLLACAACAPTKYSTRVVGTEQVRLRREPAEVAERSVEASAAGDALVLRVSSTRDCTEVQREEQLLEDRVDRDPSLGLILPGAIVAALGVSLLADPGESCEQQRDGTSEGGYGTGDMCFYDEKEANTTFGTLLVTTGAFLAVAGFATIKHRSGRRTAAGAITTRRIPNCIREPGRYLGVAIDLPDGTHLAGTSDEAGIVRLPVGADVWSRSAGVLDAKVVVEGLSAGRVTFRRELPTPALEPAAP